MIESVALSRGHEIVARIDVGNSYLINGPEFASADVAIEFSIPSAAYGNVKAAFAKGVKVVSGTTGWIRDHREEITTLCENGATLFHADNFSIGVSVFSAVNRALARMMNRIPDYSVKMREIHHIHKIDAPSGTAIALAETIEEEISRIDKVPIESLREGEIPGIHSVTYDSDADSITITHSAKSRQGYALGAVIAAEYTFNHTGLLTMEDLTTQLFV